MKALAVVIGFVFAVTVAALAIVLAFPDRFGDYLPDFMQASAQDGPQMLIEVEAGGVEIGQAVADSIKVIERRLKDLGVRFKAQPQDNDRILLSLPKSADSMRVMNVATRRGKLEFRLVEVTPWANMTPEQAVRGEPPADAEELYGPGGRGERLPYRVYKRVMLTGRDLVDAQPGFDVRTSEPIVSFRFNANGARQFAQVTQENVGKPFAIVLDNEVISAPIIREPILGGTGQISGSLTVQSANDMAILLRSGELPGELTVIEFRATKRRTP
jgi:preprotein translocase subunit SecD